ncbi:MAG: DUF1592 domain-containing protein, partial [Myxococcales bacterium]
GGSGGNIGGFAGSGGVGIGGSGGTPGPTGTGGVATPVDPNAAGPMPIRRLTQREYNNTVRDLLGDNTRPADGFPPDDHLDGVTDNYAFPVAPVVDSLLASRLRDAASSVAAAADLSKVLPCTPTAATEQACLGQFLDKFGTRAFRRPLLPAERTRLTDLFQMSRTGEALDFNGAIRTVIEGMLQSAPFLYHWELGAQVPAMEGNLVRLGPYEVASRLSYFLWASMPDDTLLMAAGNNQLSTEDQVKQQAIRLMADATRARPNLQSFYDQWLGLDQLPGRTKDPATYPQFTDPLKAAMAGEIDALVASMALDGDGRLDSLLTSTSAMITPALGAVYGMKMSGTAAQQVQLDSNQRSGLLTRAGFQALFGGAAGSNPVKRGVEIYKRLLCGHLDPPPATIPMPKDPSQGGTTRQRFAEHDGQACAANCHMRFDQYGFAFENYDGIGQFRTTDNGGAVDATGSVTLDGKAVTFTDGRQLSLLIAKSQDAVSCFASQAAAFGMGREVVDADRASLAAAVSAYNSGSKGIRDTIIAFAASRTFRYRSPAPGEVLK